MGLLPPAGAGRSGRPRTGRARDDPAPDPRRWHPPLSTGRRGRERLRRTPVMPKDMPGDAAEASSHPLRRLFAAPDFVRLWAVGALANAMRWVEILVAAVFTFEATGSAF